MNRRANTTRHAVRKDIDRALTVELDPDSYPAQDGRGGISPAGLEPEPWEEAAAEAFFYPEDWSEDWSDWSRCES